MLIKYITGLAWIWGSCSFVFVSWAVTHSDHENAAAGFWFFFVLGMPAWAWLIARYLL